MWWSTSREGCASPRRSDALHGHSREHAPSPQREPPPLSRRRPLDQPRSTPADPDPNSIAGRRASGFLQVSLSKVSRHPHRGARPATCAETPPMNASDQSGVIRRSDTRVGRSGAGARGSLGRHEARQLLIPGSNNMPVLPGHSAAGSHVVHEFSRAVISAWERAASALLASSER